MKYSKNYTYREKTLEFRSWIDNEDVITAEGIIMQHFKGTPRNKAQQVLYEICQRMLDFSPYMEDED